MVGVVTKQGDADGNNHALDSDSSARRDIDNPGPTLGQPLLWRMALGFRDFAPTPAAAAPAPAVAMEAGLPVLPVSAPSVHSDLPTSDPSGAFADGFRAWGGREEWLEHAYRVVTECEGSQWVGYYGTPYWSRAQFSADTWAKVTAITGLADPDAPFDTGANMAVWIGLIGIEAAGTSSGWPSCWWLVP